MVTPDIADRIARGCLCLSCCCRGPSEECERCGFSAEEAARRQAVPLTLCGDGLRRKIIRRKELPCDA